MCGIFGIFYTDSSRPVDSAMVKGSTDLMVHRGPDDSGYYVSGNVGLGHRRLSIIDLSSGQQPMANEDGRIITVYNGEIYNYKDIRQELISKGHTFATNCDTEVIVHGYEEWGTDCVQRFNGMFSFVLWDDRTRKLWVVRDRLGIKPLYYYSDDHVIVCSSEIKPILNTGLVRPEMNDNVLDAYFSIGYVPGPETMFKKIRKVLPGHFLLVDRNGLVDREYWDFSHIQCRETGFSEAKDHFEWLLEDSVRKRLMSDVPLGVFLSGGLDSSAVVDFMNRTSGAGSINTFTVSYNEGYSEEKHARTIAEKYRTNHNVFYLEGDDFFSSIETLIRFAEEPIVEPAAIALYHISKLARENAIVLLSGEGSDEVFGGYYLYRFMNDLEKIRRMIPRVLDPALKSISPYLPKDKYRKYADWLVSPLEKSYQGTSSYLTPSIKKRLYSPDLMRQKSSYLEDQFSSYFRRVMHKDPLSQMLYVDTKTWLVDDLLLKADKMTMAASIELRVPFLDYRMIEEATALPPEYKIQKGEGKFLLKKIMEQVLPKEIVYRKKMGFPVPTKNWFQGKLLSQVEDAIMNLRGNYCFNKEFLKETVLRHKTGKEDNSRILMTLLVYDEWQRQYL